MPEILTDAYLLFTFVFKQALTVLEEKLTEYETNDSQTAGGTQLLLLDYNIADNRFYLRHIHLLLKNS